MGEPRFDAVRHVVLDLDGTIYADDRLFDETLPFLEALQRAGVGHTFITNNTSRSTAEHREKLSRMGVDVATGELVTPVDAVVDYLQAHTHRRLYLLGTPSLRAELVAAGFETVGEGVDDEPDAVLVGFDTTLTHARLCSAAWWIDRGIPFVATHPDLVCPTREPTVLVDCGAICAALSAATGRTPLAVLGKPDPAMLHTVSKRTGVEIAAMAVVGDRLYTDIAMANVAGALSILVLTGEASVDDVTALSPGSEQRPDVVFRTLGELRCAFDFRP